jgi:hypothetical protein
MNPKLNRQKLNNLFILTVDFDFLKTKSQNKLLLNVTFVMIFYS